MGKLIINLGRNIRQLVDRGPIVPTPYVLLYPELDNGHPLHVEDFIPQSIKRIAEWMDLNSKWDVSVITQSEALVNQLCLATMPPSQWSRDSVYPSLHDKSKFFIHLYEDDNSSFRTCSLDSDGHLENWPIGWFMLKNF
jgi:hypothetical protein